VFLPWEGEYAVPETAEILVQATSIGLNDSAGRVPVDFRHAAHTLVAADVVFNPPETRFLAAAKQHGCTVLDGLGMIVHQGAIAFKLWTGVDPDIALMREAVEEFLSL
jgi:shikimate dehydrogenase